MSEGKEKIISIEQRNRELEAQNALLRGFIVGVCLVNEVPLTEQQCVALGLPRLMATRRDNKP